MVEHAGYPETPDAAGESASEDTGSPREAWESRDLQQLAEELLEFPRVREMLAGQTRFFLSRQLALEIQAQTYPEDVERLQSETAEARSMLDAVGDIGLTGTADLRPLLQRASLDGTLSGKDLVSVANTVSSLWEAQRVVLSVRGQIPRLTALAEEIADLRWLRERIFQAISDRGDVLDSATHRLGPLRKRVATTYNRLVRRLERSITRPGTRAALQSSAVATRGDRLVLEVKVEQRKAVPGIVHDVSQTGATLFVEPFEAVDLCNEWRETGAEAIREEERVLRRLSHVVGGQSDALSGSLDAAAALDLIAARARLARSMDAERVAMTDPAGPAGLRLVSARHPLLGEEVVPITVSIGPDFRALVITGPNTGGKTVALKTMGLLVLMHQAGLQIPAASGSSLSVFDKVFADIGDAQSIDRSVSTFSSHFGNVVRVLNEAGPRSLVLLDELGTGTDPEEGSALARAVLTRLAERGIAAAITTHHRAVAEYASVTDGLENASVELDSKTMLPTYHFVMGMPGRSYAMAVAKNLGLPDSLLDHAYSMLDSRRLGAEELLNQMQEERGRLRDASQAAESERIAAEKVRRDLQSRLASVHREQENLVERTRRDLRREADEVRRSLRRIAAEAKDAPNLAAVRRSVERVRQTVSDPTWFPVVPSEPETGPGEDERPLEAGDVVEIKGLDVRADVVAVNADGTVTLMMGNARIELSAQQLRRLEGERQEKSTARPDVRIDAAAVDDVSDTLDLRGVRAHEVPEKVAAFLDRCTLIGLKNCRIVHGAGTGAVRTAVREMLADMPEAAAFGPAEPAQGGNGVTLVDLA